MSPEVPFRFSDRAHTIRELSRRLLDDHGLTTWEFGFNSNVRRAGVCFYPTRTEAGRIELSIHFAERNTDEEVRDTLLHELAHALVGPGHGHDEVWRAKCQQIGARPDACYGEEVDMPRGRWQAKCAACTAVYNRHRRPGNTEGWHCRPCGPQRGRLQWRDGRECEDLPT
ncbi:MAG: sprT domain-containing protein [Planctomycetaceae bacterium]|nr:sprT domain-containing protein [Planctomycetaceae bacterium]